MKREAVVVLVDDAAVIADLVRIGCAATAAAAIAPSNAVGWMRRNRTLEIGAAFLDELDPRDDVVAQGALPFT